MKNKLITVCLIITLLGFAACTARAATTPSLSAGPPSPIPLLLPSEDPPTQTETATITEAPDATSIPQVSLDAVGDIMLGRTVGEQVLAKGPQIVFAGVQTVLDSADVRVGNLECAITASSQAEHKSFTLKAPPETARALSLGGFDVLNLANNHAMDYGYAGLMDTRNSLGQFGIATVGAGQNAGAAHTPVIIEKNGLRLAFLGYVDVLPENSGFDTRTWAATATTPGIAWADPKQITADVTAAKLQADVVIVMLHAGIEITNVINNLNDNQRSEAHAAIDAGAALVLGSHPHVLQQIERYHGGLIAYSLGNFVFDNYAGVANATIILHVLLDRSGVQSYDYIPVLIDNGLPHVISIDQAPAIGTLIAPMQP
jgi:poly-gamma-glutamate capsule biosynthesis protein CapA/YwtB (metallophosphatase superfamily)